jgi:hypothetical protein
MSRRIEVELTSSRTDGTWTWRAAGARQPKGELAGSLLYDGAKVGDVVRADADFGIEGISIIAILPPKGARREPERLEIIGPPRRDEPGVTTVLAPKGRRSGGRDRGDDRDGRPGRDRQGPRDARRGPGGPGGPGGRDNRGGDSRDGRPSRDRDRGAARPGGGDSRGRRPADGATADRRERRPRPPRVAPEPKPRAKRLKAGRAHRNQVLAALPDTHKPIAEQLVRGGIPGVRQAVDRQNELLRADGKPEINPDPLMDIAERLMPVLRVAEWRDKAEAALADADDIDVRDLRSVVVAADAGARDEETRALADQLRAALAQRVDREHHAWLEEITENLDQSRLVRALRLSSRPPKAGAPFPAELAKRLAETSSASFTADITGERYATVLDALAFSPVRLQVVPAHVPAEPAPELLTAIKKFASRLPQIATLFGVEASASRGPRPAKAAAGAPVPPPPPASAPIPPPPPAAAVVEPAPAEAEPEAEAVPEPVAAAAEPAVEAVEPVESVEAAPSADATATDGPAPTASAEDAAASADQVE